jgi:F-type H+-transporting ATPase subunit b
VQSKAFLPYILNQNVDESKLVYYPNSTEKYYKELSPDESLIKTLPSGVKLIFAGNIGESQSFETLLNAAREERTNLLREAKDIKDKIINEAKEQAKEEANKIIAEARQQIDQQKNAALVDVKNQIGSLVIEVSEKVLRKELSNKNEANTYINTLASELKLN